MKTMWTVLVGEKNAAGQTKITRYDIHEMEDVIGAVTEKLREGCAVCVLP